MKGYVTFGQNHTHSINSKTFNKDCVAVIECTDYDDDIDKAFELFGTKFCMYYFDKEYNKDHLKYYPRGFIDVN